MEETNWEAITGIASVVIALCALLFTVWQARQTRRHDRISVTPHLTTWRHTNPEENLLVVELMNNGIGPAMFESFELFVDGKLVPGEQSEPIKKALKILFPGYDYKSHQSYFAKGYVMAEKEKRPIVAVRFFGEKTPSSEEVDHAMKRSRIRISYQSMYGKVFCLDSDEERIR